MRAREKEKGGKERGDRLDWIIGGCKKKKKKKNGECLG